MMTKYLKQNGAYFALFGLFLISSVLTEGSFFSARNLSHLLRQSSINGVLAVGMTLVILIGGIDLSIGSLVALCGVVAGLMQTQYGMIDLGMPGAIATLAAACVSGLFLGLLNGGLIAFLRIPPFVITLGAMVIARGCALLLSNGSAISPFSESFSAFADYYLEGPAFYAVILLFIAYFAANAWKNRMSGTAPLVTLLLFSGSFFLYRGLPMLCLIFLLTFVIVDFILSQTVMGRSLYALGSNEQAAFWAGVPINRVKIFAYSVLGLLSGLASVMLSARLNSAAPTSGQLFELDAIASTVIGGVSLKGGIGTLSGTLAGVLMIATVNNGMDLLQVQSFYQMILKGLIIIAAVSFDRSQKEGA